MEDLLTCTVCFEPFNLYTKVPLSLICGHTFCKECLLLMKSSKKPLSCPLDSTLDTRDFAAIPKNYTLLEIITISKPKSLIPKSVFVTQTQSIIESCKSGLSLLQKAQTSSSQHKAKSKSELNFSFNSLRELLSYRESELLNNIDLTHKAIDDKIEILFQEFLEILQKHEENVKVLKNEPEVDTEKVYKTLPNLEKIDEINEIIQRLPVKVLTSLNHIENSVLSFTKVIDDTQTRVSQLKFKFVEDSKDKGRSRFLPNSTFVKTWKVLNDGDVAWPNGCWCVFTSGDYKGESIVVDPAWPNEQVDITVVLSTPSTPGTYTSSWKLIDPQGLTFGPTLLSQIEVYKVL